MCVKSRKCPARQAHKTASTQTRPGLAEAGQLHEPLPPCCGIVPSRTLRFRPSAGSGPRERVIAGGRRGPGRWGAAEHVNNGAAARGRRGIGPATALSATALRVWGSLMVDWRHWAAAVAFAHWCAAWRATVRRCRCKKEDEKRQSHADHEQRCMYNRCVGKSSDIENLLCGTIQLARIDGHIISGRKPPILARLFQTSISASERERKR